MISQLLVVSAAAARRAAIPARQRPGARAPRMPGPCVLRARAVSLHLLHTPVYRHRLARPAKPPPLRRRRVQFRPRLRGGASSFRSISKRLRRQRAVPLVQVIPTSAKPRPRGRVGRRQGGVREKSGTKSARRDHVYGSPSWLSTGTVARANKSLAAKNGSNEDKLFHYTPACHRLARFTNRPLELRIDFIPRQRL